MSLGSVYVPKYSKCKHKILIQLYKSYCSRKKVGLFQDTSIKL